MDQPGIGWKMGGYPPISCQQVAKPCVVDFRGEIKGKSGTYIEECKRNRDWRLNLGLNWPDGIIKLDSSRLRGQAENKKGIFIWVRAFGKQNLGNAWREMDKEDGRFFLNMGDF